MNWKIKATMVAYVLALMLAVGSLPAHAHGSIIAFESNVLVNQPLCGGTSWICGRAFYRVTDTHPVLHVEVHFWRRPGPSTSTSDWVELDSNYFNGATDRRAVQTYSFSWDCMKDYRTTASAYVLSSNGSKHLVISGSDVYQNLC